MHQKVRIVFIEINSELIPQLLDFRNRLLRKPLGLSLFDENLEEEAQDRSLVALHNNCIVGCVLLRKLAPNILKLRQMAVEPSWQGKGLGTQLMRAAEQAAQEMKIEHLKLHARKSATGFYEKLGYHPVGDTFTEVGLPHIAMEKNFS